MDYWQNSPLSRDLCKLITSSFLPTSLVGWNEHAWNKATQKSTTHYPNMKNSINPLCKNKATETDQDIKECDTRLLLWLQDLHLHFKSAKLNEHPFTERDLDPLVYSMKGHKTKATSQGECLPPPLHVAGELLILTGEIFFFWSRLWLLINSPWQWAASLCLGGHCLSYYILFFHLDSIIIKKILSGVISATNTEVIHLFHHPFCWLLRLSEKESILETQSSPREVQWLAQGHTAS